MMVMGMGTAARQLTVPLLSMDIFRWVSLIWPPVGWRRLWRRKSGNGYGFSMPPTVWLYGMACKT